MCAILDANVAGQVFGTDRPPAGEAFFRWINSERGRLVVGGRLLEELDQNRGFTEWFRQAILAGRVVRLNEEAVTARTQQLLEERACRSDDEHVVAAALLGGARLLYTNDRDLQRDFKNRNLIDEPRGKIYSTLLGGQTTNGHRRLLGSRRLCRR